MLNAILAGIVGFVALLIYVGSQASRIEQHSDFGDHNTGIEKP